MIPAEKKQKCVPILRILKMTTSKPLF